MQTTRLATVRGLLAQHQWIDKRTGKPLRGFTVRNSHGKTLAIGAMWTPLSAGFCIMHAKRYEHDADLVRAVEKLTGQHVRTN